MHRFALISLCIVVVTRGPPRSLEGCKHHTRVRSLMVATRASLFGLYLYHIEIDIYMLMFKWLFYHQSSPTVVVFIVLGGHQFPPNHSILIEHCDCDVMSEPVLFLLLGYLAEESNDRTVRLRQESVGSQRPSSPNEAI
jgi:hypothetical protein